MALKALLICVAVPIGIWASATFPIFWSEASIDKIGSRIAAGEAIKRLPLLALQPQLNDLELRAWPTPQSLHNVASIELRLAEIEVETGEKITANRQFMRAQSAIENALRYVPSDAFLWAALFWLVKTRDGMSDSAVSYLRMSYLVGPNEGWVAVRRNRLAVALLPVLPKDLSDLVVSEFGNLVTSGYIAAAADIVTGPGWSNHHLLLKSLGNVPEDERRQLADAIYELGFDVLIPDVEPRGRRPWK